MSLTENSDQVFLPGGCNRTQNLRFGPYTIYDNSVKLLLALSILEKWHHQNGRNGNS